MLPPANYLFFWKIVASIVIFAVLVESTSNENIATECQGNICSQQHGYIKSRPNKSFWRLTSKNFQPTTFVLVIRNIQISNLETRWLNIYQSYYAYPNVYQMKGNKDGMFIFKNTITVDIQRFENNAKFELEFYIGCEVLEGKEIAIKAPTTQIHTSTYQIVPPTCWLIIPTIKETVEVQTKTDLQNLYLMFGLYYRPQIQPHRYIEVQETYLFLQDISLNNNLTISNALTGNTLISASGNTKTQLSVLQKENQSINLLNENRQISTMILMKLDCENTNCQQNEFLFQAIELQQKDLDCMEKESKCRFNIGIKNFTCGSPTPNLPPDLLLEGPNQTESTSCQAYQQILSILSDAPGIQQRGKCLMTKSQICYKATNGCGKFSRSCSRKCVLYKYVYGACGHTALFG